MGTLAIVCGLFCLGHTLTIAIRQNGIHASLGLPRGIIRANTVASFWATLWGLAALGLGIAGAVT